MASTLWRLLLHPWRLFDVRRWRRRLGALRSRRPTFDLRAASLNDTETEFLVGLVRRTADHPGPIIEVGTLFGRTTIEMALAKQPGQKIIAVDRFAWNPWHLPREQHMALTQHALRYLTATGNVELVVADKDDFYRGYDGPAPALVFLDADHSYEATKHDIEWAQSVGAGIICGHNYSPGRFTGVVRATEDCGGVHEVCDRMFLMNDHQGDAS